jgi:hypothetical protein
MKNLFTLLIALLLTNVSFTQEWIEFTASESTEPSYDLKKSLDTVVEFDLTVPGMFSTEIDSFNRVQIQEHIKFDSVGFPEIPVLSYLVAIPDCDSVNVEISLLDSIRVNDIFIYPSPELVPDTTIGGAIALVEQFVFDTTVYETDCYFPGYVAETKDKGAIRDQYVVRVLYYPVQFNPVKHEAMVYSKANIKLTFHNSSGTINNDVGIFNEVVGNTLLNYNSNGLNASVSCGAGLDNAGTVAWFTELPNQLIDSACDYLIITHQDFYTDTVAKKEIDSLAYHRASFNGFDVAITTRAAIINAFPDPFQPGYEKFFGLILNTYNSKNANHTYDGKLAYVNLFGDVELQDGSPGIPTYSEGYDVYFTQLTYDSIAGEYDPYPDIMIGRCSVDDTEQVQNVVHKILHYKPEENYWKNNFYSVIGVNDPPNYSSPKNSMDLLHPMLTADSTFLSYDDDFNYSMPDWINIPYTSPNYSSIINKLSEGVQHYLYTGHGSPSGTSVLDYSDLNPDGN